jgi:hypothetical protein
MFSRPSRLLIIVTLSLNTALANEKGWYLPVTGYTSISEKKLSSPINGLTLGIIGYSFSNDFKLEVTGLGCREKILLARKHSIQPHTNIPVESLQRRPQSPVLSTKDLDKVTEPKEILEKLPSDTVSISPNSVSPSVANSMSIDKLIAPVTASSATLFENPWEEDLSSKETAQLAQKSSTAQSSTASATIIASTDTTAQSQHNNPIEPQSKNTPPAQVKTSTAPFVTHSIDISNTTTQSHQDSTQSTQVVWGGVVFVGQCTLLHLHPRCQMYWSPGITLLYPLHKELSSIFMLTLGMGVRWIVNAKFTLDISGTTTLKKWGAAGSVDSFLAQPKLQFFNINLQWHL